MISFNSVKLACLDKFKEQLGVVEHNRVCHNSNALCGMDKIKHKVYVRIFTGNKTFTIWISKKACRSQSRKALLHSRNSPMLS